VQQLLTKHFSLTSLFFIINVLSVTTWCHTVHRHFSSHCTFGVVLSKFVFTSVHSSIK